jgi:hypothetical protein
MVESILMGVWLLAAAADAAAQDALGSIQGVARSDDDGSLIPFALVRLHRVDEQDDSASTSWPRRGMTTANGRFRFAHVPPGTYRVQLLRIGYRPVLSSSVNVGAGETIEHELKAPTRAVQLAAVTVRPGETCLTASRLSERPELATLWEEARKGVEIRRAFDLRYRYVRTVRQEGTVNWRLRGSRPLRRTDTLVNEPDSVLAREERSRALHRERGYSRGGLLSLPNEKELVDDEFLRDHCIETPVELAEGMFGLRFRRVQPRSEGLGIRGTIWVDADTYLMRRLDVEWVRGNRRVGESRVDYTDVAVDGGTLRLPSGGQGSARASGVQRTLVTGATARLTFTYRDFEQRLPE